MWTKITFQLCEDFIYVSFHMRSKWLILIESDMIL